MNLPRIISLIGGAFAFAACGAQVEVKDTSLAAPFVGSWQVAKPDAKGVVFNAPLSDCAAPVVITKGRNDDAETLKYNSPKADPSEMELMFFNDRTTWIPAGNGPTTLIAEVKDKDKFWLYTATMGKADWDNPLEYKRCNLR